LSSCCDVARQSRAGFWRLVWRPLPQNARALVFWGLASGRSGLREDLGGDVPLSEHEQRQLEQIEQALYAEHPRFAKAVRAADPRVHYKRRLVYAVVLFVIGVGLLPAGVSTYIAISISGFVIMLASCYWAAMSYRRMNGLATGRIQLKERRRSGRKDSRKDKGGGRRSGGLGERLDERWRRRQEGRDG
jgi:uncharacterized membrane protein YgcG